MNNAWKTSPVDAQVEPTQIVATLFPPQLPPFLSTVFNLQPIVGTPKPEEVKLIHAAIRTVNSLSQTPEMRDSDLPIELAQYLFDVQIACYREKYPVNIFPNDIVYTPPDLPAHIPVTLNPVVGPPQDKDLKAVHSALRITESFANVASLFDPDMHMGLSQHLFDLQLARRIQRSNMLQPLPADQGSRSRTLARTNIPDSNSTEESGEAPGTEASSGADSSDTLRRDSGPTSAGHKNGESRESTNSLAQVQETLQDIKKIMVASQNSLARGFNSSYQTANTGYSLGAHSVINEKGETPEMHGLPTVKGNSYINSSFATTLQVEELARYLQFYSIGKELVEDGEILRIRPGMEENARQLLKQRIGVH